MNLREFLAKIPEHGTAVRYEHKGDTLKLTLYGKPDMPKLPRTEEETSDNQRDIDWTEHTDLCYIRCYLKAPHYCFVDLSESREENKGYTKLLYLKLAKWCLKKGYTHIIGNVVEKSAIPIFMRYRIPKSTHRIWIDLQENIS
jgi:hypothetical protein